MPCRERPRRVSCEVSRKSPVAAPVSPAIQQNLSRYASQLNHPAVEFIRRDAMEWSIIESRWHEYKGAAKRQWDKLSEAQLSGTKGNREYLLKRVQEAYALSRD